MRAAALHGDMSQTARTSAPALRSGAADTLVATDVAARGLDVDRVSVVVNSDPPDETTRTAPVGRTGRAGRTGTGITLVLEDERIAWPDGRKAGVEGASCERTLEPLAQKTAPTSANYRACRPRVLRLRWWRRPPQRPPGTRRRRAGRTGRPAIRASLSSLI